jgi:hypothetical protein
MADRELSSYGALGARFVMRDAAGRDGVTKCTAGIGNSGFVSLSWPRKRKSGAATIGATAVYLNIAPPQTITCRRTEEVCAAFAVFANYDPTARSSMRSESVSWMGLREGMWVRLYGHKAIHHKNNVW